MKKTYVVTYCILLLFGQKAIRLNMCAVNGLRSIVLDIISITLACHEMLASQ